MFYDFFLVEGKKTNNGNRSMKSSARCDRLSAFYRKDSEGEIIYDDSDLFLFLLVAPQSVKVNYCCEPLVSILKLISSSHVPEIIQRCLKCFRDSIALSFIA